MLIKLYLYANLTVAVLMGVFNGFIIKQDLGEESLKKTGIFGKNSFREGWLKKTDIIPNFNLGI